MDGTQGTKVRRIVITTLKRCRVNLLEWVPLCSSYVDHHSFSQFYVLRRLHGLCLWERRLVASIRRQHLTFPISFSLSFLLRYSSHLVRLLQPFSRSSFVRYLLPALYLSCFPLVFFFSSLLSLLHDRLWLQAASSCSAEIVVNSCPLFVVSRCSNLRRPLKISQKGFDTLTHFLLSNDSL